MTLECTRRDVAIQVHFESQRKPRLDCGQPVALMKGEIPCFRLESLRRARTVHSQ